MPGVGKVADSWEDLISNGPSDPIVWTEKSDEVDPVPVWTNTNHLGQSLGEVACDNWTNADGVEVADSLCRGRSNSSGLKTDADFLAWISDDTTSPAERFFRSPGRYVLPDGTVVANSREDLTDGTLQNPIDMTEVMGIPEAHHAWTNTAPDGTRLSDESCNNWTSSEPLENSFVGGTTMVDEQWTNRGVPTGCDIHNHIYCFEQGPG